MKQLDVDVSPPPSIISLILDGICYKTFRNINLFVVNIDNEAI